MDIDRELLASPAAPASYTATARDDDDIDNADANNSNNTNGHRHLLAYPPIYTLLKKESKIYDELMIGDIKNGPHVSWTDQSENICWKAILEHPFVIKLLGTDKMNVVDIKSGSNTFNITGHLHTDKINVAVGIENSPHRAKLAATYALRLINKNLMQDPCKGIIGMCREDFVNPLLNLSGFNIVKFWNRDVHPEDYDKFYKGELSTLSLTLAWLYDLIFPY